MRSQLVCRVRRGLVLTFDLREDEMVVGREKGLAVAVPLKGVSRRHARITREQEAFFIEDLSSTNGTFLNGQPISREELWHLDVITLGKEAELVYVERTKDLPALSRQGILSASLTSLETEEVHPIAVGEVILGRSAACNIVAEASAVSKMHARIERTSLELIIEDLGSANGTFVNGVQQRTALLSNGDTIALAGVESYRVEVRRGDVKSTTSGRHRLAAPAERKQQSFPQNWKTRFDWDVDEFQKFAERIRLERGLTLAPAAPAPTQAPVKEVKGEAVPAPIPSSSAKEAKEAKDVVVAPPPPPPRVEALAPTPVESPPAESPQPERRPARGTLLSVTLTGPSVNLTISEPGPYLLGRAKDVPLKVDDKSISRVHARLILSDDRSQVLVQDMGSVNGTKLNREPVRKLTALSDGDVITLGLVDLTVRLVKAEP